MKIFKITLFCLFCGFFCLTLSSCLLPYLVKSGYHQAHLLLQRKPIESILEDPDIDEKIKKKLQLVQQARSFAVQKLHLQGSQNYTTYVNLKRPYVTYIVRVAKAHQLEPYLFRYPFLGPMPYKGFFSLEEAKKEAASFDTKKYDTYVRGVTAYSSLGWWEEPILSSMISYKDSDLVETVFHEMVHGTVFIKGHVDFNERLATAFSQKGVKLFYLEKEGKNSPTLINVEKRHRDKKLFANFISKEIKSLKKWYQEQKTPIKEEEKRERLTQIQRRFSKNIKEKLETSYYFYFEKISLNNARLLSYKTYVYHLEDFEKLFAIFENKILSLLSFLKALEKQKSPEVYLKNFIASQLPH